MLVVLKSRLNMEDDFIEKNNSLKIETIKGPNGSSASFCAERGGIITSLKLKGKEVPSSRDGENVQSSGKAADGAAGGVANVSSSDKNK